MTPNIKRTWLNELDRGKGLAILLVVIGHVVARKPPEGAGWYLMLKFSVYLFHMPFFVFLSAVVMAYTYKPIQCLDDYVEYIKPKFKRFIPIFLIFGLIILLGKYLIGQVIVVDNTSKDFVSGVENLIFFPGISPASTLWYIYVLFMYYLIFPIFYKVKSYAFVGLILISSFFISFYAYLVTHLFLLDRFAEFLCFAIIGWIVGQNYQRFLKFINHFGWVFLILFSLAVLFFNLLFYKCIVHGDCSYFPEFFNTIHATILTGLLSIPALIYLLTRSFFSNQSWLKKIGKYVFIIYLLNTITIGIVKGVGLKFVGWDNQNFYFYFPILLASGVFIPILIKKFVLVKFPRLDKATW